MTQRLGLRGLLSAAASTLFALSAGAQTIVNTGDDLAAIVAAAADGAVIEIQSDATFVGTLTWNAKTVTVQAGAGYSPVVRGSDGGHAVYILPAVPTTHGIFKGIRLERGDTTPSFPIEAPALFLQCWNTAPAITELDLEDCTVLGQVNTGGTGTSDGKGTFLRTTFEGPVSMFGFLGAPLDMTFEDCTFETNFTALNGAHLGTPRSTLLSVRRSRFLDEVGLNAYDSGSLTVMFESCLVDGGGIEPYGVRVYNDTSGTLSNLTVTGCTTGIQGQPGVSWHNMLLYGNGQDLSGVAATEIEYSLIADGTHAGVNNNFTGTPVLGSDYELLVCSPGIDAGSNTAPGLGSTDLQGAPRFQDNDADLTFLVNVGAVESTGSLPGLVRISNGTGQNPMAYINTNLPMAGSSYTAFISPAAATFITVIAIDAPSAPVTSPAWVGELLLIPSGGTLFDFALGPHSIPILPACDIVGLTFYSQGFRIDNFMGVVSTHCLNRIDLTIGG